jgi:CubicO group peptidase (beta-lactamase class C family)
MMKARTGKQPVHPSILLSLLLCFPLASGAAAQPPPRIPEAEAIAALKAELQQKAKDGRFSGAVLVAKGSKPVFEAAYGYADREKKVSNTADTKFRFGSMGKMFTAVAVMQLVESGRIKLADPIAKYLPDYPNKEVAAVTIHQLLTHTGGTGDIFGPEFDAHRAELREIGDYVALYGSRGLQFAPGSRWDYSNYGYLLLGRIIEVTTGRSYYDYVREHVFKPAGMDATGNLPEDQHVPDLAVVYSRGGPPRQLTGPGPGHGPAERLPPPPNGPLRPAVDTLPYRGTSAGGGYSTVEDLLKFVNGLTSAALLDAHSTEILTTGKVSTPRPGTRYAYGFEDQTTPDGLRQFGHGGGAPGMNGRLSVFPQSGYVVIVLANLDPPAADEIARFIGDRLPAR